MEQQNLSTEETSLKLTREIKEEIGIKCKHILDYARVQYLEKRGYKCSLKYYVNRTITLENVCLIAQLIT